jgi:hypothetical protein
VSRQFVAASSNQLRVLCERRLEDLNLVVLMWQGGLVRESTKQGNDKIARQMESAHRTAQAKGEVGIREKKPVPALKEFLKAGLPSIRRDAACSEAPYAAVLHGRQHDADKTGTGGSTSRRIDRPARATVR